MSLYTDLQSCKVESDVAIVYNNLFKSQFGITPEQKNNCDSYFYLGDFAFADKSKWRQIANALKGRKYLI